MKRNAILRIVLFSIVIVILLGLLIAGFAAGSFFSFRSGGSSLEGGTLSSSGSVTASQIKDIEIEWVAGSITIQPGDVDSILFEETGAKKESEMMVWKQSGDTLIIQFSEGDTVSFGFNNSYSKDLTITVPKDWSCDELSIDSVSAKIDVSDLTINEMDLDNVSGVCTFGDCAVGTISLDTVSGDIRFGGTLNILECDAVSASCIITLLNTPQRVDMDGVSGDLDLTLPEDCGFTVSVDTGSGGFSSDFATTTQNGNYVYGDGSCRINVSGVSGDVTIRKGAALEARTF